MTTLTINDPVPGQSNQTEEPKIPQAFDAIKAWANGQIGIDNLLSTFARQMLVAPNPGATQPKWSVGTNVMSGPGNPVQYGISITQAHGLGITPQIAFANAFNANVHASIVGNPDQTNIQIAGHYLGGSGTGETWPPAWPGSLVATIAWIVIGW